MKTKKNLYYEKKEMAKKTEISFKIFNIDKGSGEPKTLVLFFPPVFLASLFHLPPSQHCLTNLC